MSEINPDKCDQEVYKNGVLVGIYDIPKDHADTFCKLQTSLIGIKHDWHYAAGRVVVKALTNPKPVHEDVARELTQAVAAMNYAIKKLDEAEDAVRKGHAGLGMSLIGTARHVLRSPQSTPPKAD